VRILDTKEQKNYLYTYMTKIKYPITVETETIYLYMEPQKTPKHYRDNFHRYCEVSEHVADWIFSVVEDDTADFYIEDYAYSAMGKTFTIGEFCGLLKRRIYEKGFCITPVSISAIKKTLTTKGNAQKLDIWAHSMTRNDDLSEILQMVEEITPYPYQDSKTPTDTAISDIIDAFGVLETILKT
jgi:Holliday junction resolvasome RuvABC endonuclease subunit